MTQYQGTPCSFAPAHTPAPTHLCTCKGEESIMSEFKIQDVVTHSHYGRGTVIAFRPESRAVVQFRDHDGFHGRAVVQFRDHDGFHGRLPLIVDESTLTLTPVEWCLLDLQAAMITYLRPMPAAHKSRVARGIRRNDLDALRYAFPRS